jgi:hypothetical protein
VIIPSSRVLPPKGPYATNLPRCSSLAGIKDLTKPVVLVSGTDPLNPGGHESYVRAHGIAAIRVAEHLKIKDNRSIHISDAFETPPVFFLRRLFSTAAIAVFSSCSPYLV